MGVCQAFGVEASLRIQGLLDLVIAISYVAAAHIDIELYSKKAEAQS